MLPLLTVLAACAAPSDPAAAAEATELAEATAPGRPSLEAVLDRLPREAAGFRRGGTGPAGGRLPTSARLVNYATPSRTAAAQVFLYDPVAAPGRVPDVAGELASAVAEAAGLSADRTGRSFNETSRHGLPVPRGTPVSCAVLDGYFGRNPVERHVCVASAAGRVLRIVVTMPDRNPERAEAARSFAREVVTAARG